MSNAYYLDALLPQCLLEKVGYTLDYCKKPIVSLTISFNVYTQLQER